MGAAHGESISEEQLARRALVWTKSSKWSEAPLRKRKISCETLARYKSLLYVECFGMSGPKLLRTLAALPGVRGVARDREVVPVQHALPPSPFLPRTVGASGLDSSGVCRLSETCPDGRAKFWGQERLDADLMFGQLNRIQLGKGHTKVAVIDTGFDMTQARTLMDESLVSVSKGWEGAGDPNRDELGHGTAVAGLIGGKNGVGLAPDARLSIYRVSEGNSSGGATSSSLMMSVMKACDDGNEVINLSWGGQFDENAIFEDEASSKAFYDELASKGCLVVKAAGNAARRVERKHMDIDDALLRVEATEPSGQLASFSSNGEVSAPGADVFTLHSSQSPSANKESTCGAHQGAFISGTSFAAPLTAAIATQTLGVLKKNPNFVKLSGPQRVSTLNRVLAVANMNGGLNGLRAVMIADMLRQQPKALPIPSVEEISENFKKRAAGFCATPRPLCQQSASSCQQERECSAQSRQYLAFCAPPRPEIVRDLLRISDKTRSTELSLNVLRHSNVFTAAESAQHTQKIWAQLHSQWNTVGRGNVSKAMSFDQAMQLLPTLTQSRRRSGLNSDVDIALGNFLTSDQLKNRLSRDLKADSQTDLDRVLVAMQNAYESMGASNFLRMLQESARKNVSVRPEDNKMPIAGFTSTARLIGAMISNPRFAGIKENLIGLERAMAVRAQDIGLSEQSKVSGYFDSLYSRNSDLVAAHLKTVISPGGKVDLSSLPVQYLLANPERVPKEQRTEFNTRVIEAYREQLADPKTILGGTASLSAAKAIDNLQQSTKDLPESERLKIQEAYWSRLGKAQSEKERLAAFPNQGLFFFNFTYRDLQQTTLFKGDVLHDQSESVAQQLIANPDEWKSLGISRTTALYKILPFLVRKQESKALVPPLGVLVLDTLMAGGAGGKSAYSADIDLGASADSLSYLVSNEDARLALKADPSFMASIKKLKNDLNKRSERYAKQRSALNTTIANLEKP